MRVRRETIGTAKDNWVFQVEYAEIRKRSRGGERRGEGEVGYTVAQRPAAVRIYVCTKAAQSSRARCYFCSAGRGTARLVGGVSFVCISRRSR